MEHFLNDYWYAQLVWSSLLLLTYILIKTHVFDSIYTKYELLRNVFLTFPLILLIKVLHLELPFSLYKSTLGAQSVSFGSIIVEKESFASWMIFTVIFTVIFTFKLYSYWKSNRIKRNTKHVNDERILHLFNSVLKELNLTNKTIHIKSDNYIGTPYCYGLKEYSIVIPNHLLQSENFGSIRTILLHELNHIKRKDTVYLIVEEMVQFLSALNPFTYFFHTKINEYREHRCDQDVIDSNLVSKRDYATTLLDIKLKTQHGYWPIPVAQLTTQSSHLERRIKSMKNLQKKDSKIKIALSALFLSVAIILASCENKTEAISTDEHEVVDVANSKIDMSKMTQEERAEFKKRLKSEKEVALNKVKGANFELLDGTIHKGIDENVTLQNTVDGKGFIIREQDGKEHRVDLTGMKNHKMSKKEAARIISNLKLQETNSHTFKLRELKESIADPSKNVKFGEVFDKVKELRSVELKEVQKKNVKN